MFKSASIGVVIAILMTGAAQADDINDVISDQLDAFDQADVARAWSFASPMIQGMFGTPENFGRMVQRGYPSIWNNDTFQFTDRKGQSGIVRQIVVITDDAGALSAFEYELIETGEGWKINGVRPVPLPDFSV